MLLRMKGRVAALVAVGALVMLAGVVARGASAVPLGKGEPLLDFLVFSEIDLSVVPGGGDVTEEPEVRGGGWTQAVSLVVVLVPLLLLAGAIVAAVVISLLNWRRRRRMVATPVVVDDDDGYPGVPSARLLRAARQARLDLERHRGGPPSDAVVAAWLRLEEAAAGSGLARLAHQTPTEFTDALRTRDGSVEPALDELRRLYQRARFARSAAIGPDEVTAARAALDEIVHGLAGKPVTV
jgi:hypothetical protein